MPKPLPLPTRAKHIMKALENTLQDQQQTFFDVVLAVYEDEKKEAIEALRAAALRNNLVLRTLTLLLANEFEAAEEVIVQIKAQFEREGK